MKILITTSTLPVSEDDKVPAFVKDQAIELKKKYPSIDILVHAPHSALSKTLNRKLGTKYYKDVRFHYFWPFRWELLAGHAIMPTLKQNKLLYLQIPFLFLFQFISLLRLARKENPDLLYAHWFTPQAINTALVSKLTRTPFVFTTHASDVSVLRKFPFSKKLVAWVCRHAYAYTAVSERTATKLESFFDKKDWTDIYRDKLTIIPMGVSLTAPIIKNTDIKRVKKIYKLPDHKKIILFLGRLAEKKGVNYLIEAFSNLSDEIAKDLQLVIAGDGQLKDYLVKQTEKLKLDNVTFTGYVYGKNKDALIDVANYTCFPSIIDSSGDSEGFPVVIMESLAAGKIVLASNVSGGETILKSGQSGFIFDQKSAKNLKQSLMKAVSLSEKERLNMQKKSRNLASQFSWPLIAEKHYAVFKGALRENTSD